jgi:uncharacterized protein YeaO (DUF488 family)
MSLFGKKVLNNEELENEIELQKSQIKRELAYYRREQMLSIDEEIQKYKLKRELEIVEMEKTCHRQLAQYEHTFHSTKEELGIELAKLEAKAETLREALTNNSSTAIIAAKDNEINRLVSVINALTKIKNKV